MKKVIAILTCLIIFAVSSASGESATSALQELYAQAELMMASGDYAGAAAQFEALGAYSDSSQMAMYCKAIYAAEDLKMFNMAMSAFNDLGDFRDSKQMAIYYDGREKQYLGDSIDLANASEKDLNAAEYAYNEAVKTYSSLALFKDCLNRVSDCQTRLTEIAAERRKRSSETTEKTYQEALRLVTEGKKQEAVDKFSQIIDYKDSRDRIMELRYQIALELKEKERYQDAIKAFTDIKDYKDSKEQISACEDCLYGPVYEKALALEQQKEYAKAIKQYEKIKNYKDSATRIEECYTAINESVYQEALALEETQDYLKAVEIYKTIQDYKDSEQRISACETKYNELRMQCYTTDTGKMPDDFPLLKGILLGETHGSYTEKAKKAGLKDEGHYDHRAASEGGYGWYYWEQDQKISDFGSGDVFVYFTGPSFSDNIKCFFVQYSFNGDQSKEGLTDTFGKINDWLIAQYGDPSFTETDPEKYFVLPTTYNSTPTYAYLMKNKDGYPWSCWITRLSDGSCISIVNAVSNLNTNKKNVVSFTLYDAQTVKDCIP